jgi:hypothetical protein
MKQFVSSDDAVHAERQHEKPCGDCPFSRKAIPGWLGDGTVESWLADAHGETQINCHTLIGPQCAGAATYRSNVYKRPHSRAILLLPRDEKLVFTTAREFKAHHESKP